MWLFPSWCDLCEVDFAVVPLAAGLLYIFSLNSPLKKRKKNNSGGAHYNGSSVFVQLSVPRHHHYSVVSHFYSLLAETHKRNRQILVMLLGAKENTGDKMCKTWCNPQLFWWSRLKYCTKAVKEEIPFGSPLQLIGSFAGSLMFCIIGANLPSLFVCATLDSNVLLNLMHVVPTLFAPQPTPFCSSLKDNQINGLQFKTILQKIN